MLACLGWSTGPGLNGSKVSEHDPPLFAVLLAEAGQDLSQRRSSLRQVSGHELRLAEERGQAHRAEPREPLRQNGGTSSTVEQVAGVVEHTQRLTVVAASGETLGLHRIEPRMNLGRRVAAARVRTGPAHPLGHLLPLAGPARDEGAVPEDRGAEQLVVGGAGGVQRADEGRVGCCGGLPEIEELDPSQQQQGLGERSGEHAPGDAGGLAEQGLAQGGVFSDGPVQGGGGDGPVHLPVRGGDRRVGGTDGLGLHAVDLSRVGDRWAGCGRDHRCRARGSGRLLTAETEL